MVPLYSNLGDRARLSLRKKKKVKIELLFDLGIYSKEKKSIYQKDTYFAIHSSKDMEST